MDGRKGVRVLISASALALLRSSTQLITRLGVVESLRNSPLPKTKVCWGTGPISDRASRGSADSRANHHLKGPHQGRGSPDNGPPSRAKKQKTKKSLPASTSTTSNPPVELLLAPEDNESQLDIVAGQPLGKSGSVLSRCHISL